MNSIALFVFNILFALSFMCANKIPLLSIISNRVGFIAVLLSFLTIIAEHRARKLPLFAFLWLLFTAYGLTTMLWSLDSDSTYLMGMRQIYLALVFGLALLSVRTETNLINVLRSACIGSGVMLAGTIWSYVTRRPYAFTDVGDLSDSSRYSFLNINPNFAGAVFAICLPIAWWIFHVDVRSNRLVKSLAYFLVILTPVGIVLTASRGAALASVFGCGYVVLSIIRSKHPYKNAAYVIGVVLAGLIVISLFKTSGNISQSIDRLIGAGFDLKSKNVVTRFEFWGQTWNIFSNHPIIGVGIGSGRIEYEGIGNLSVSHNAVLSILSEYGLIGFFLFIGIVVQSVRAALTCPLRYKAMFLLCLATLFVIVMKESFEPEPFFWTTLLLPVLASRVLRTDKEPVKEDLGDRVATGKPALQTASASGE